MATLIELGHTIYEGMPMYPGLPTPHVTPWLTHEASRPHYGHRAEFALTKLELAGNTGTYLDSPWHRHPDSADIGALDLHQMADLPGVVVDGQPCNGGRGVHVDIDGRPLVGSALLIRTGWSKQWGTDAYWTDGPYLTDEALDHIIGAKPHLVGVDFSNVDDITDPQRPAHTRLLEAGVLIVEHLTGLDDLPAEGFKLHCVPLAIRGAAAVPVRPYAVLDAAARY